MNFKELLSQAKDDDLQAKEPLLERYKSLLWKEAIIDGVFDEDLYQELCVTLLDCIRKFRIETVKERDKGLLAVGPSDSCTEIMDAAFFSTPLRINPAKSQA